jgi:hypothetical protein
MQSVHCIYFDEYTARLIELHNKPLWYLFVLIDPPRARWDEITTGLFPQHVYLQSAALTFIVTYGQGGVARDITWIF